MTQNNNLNVNLFNSKINNLKSRTENGTEVIWNLLSNITGDSNDEANFQNKLLWTDRQCFVRLLERASK